MTSRHESNMRWAIALALEGAGRTSPNPMVGALVVKGGRVVGEGYHARAGEPHAEVHALARAGRRALGATLYVTLEPCCHEGKTPPCVDAIIAAGIREVVVGARDPNPKVDGRGIRALKRAGVSVVEGV
ncbi:MAG TPA: bifunctional diaminohydroxyphosphoribosylaminopyrimidine deaminase/5-amino-6-(5-phosphoribosylamino)uracil reductase RibD, partial [bacterium]|nr:bifunctional diaminohydroxyphosphoribosylaminopyrimidine deaminase/5-amino-6-(5-phosphoribosylamino)uracil reductase RibD [bacterium]